MNRGSRSVFDFPDNVSVTYHAPSEYIACSCSEFSFAGKCPHAMDARQVLETEGMKVKFKRVPVPTFVAEVEKFEDSIRTSIKRRG